MEYLKRNLYLDQLIALNNTPDIKIITGIRRCGKSILLDEYSEYLRNTEPECNIVKINLQELEYEGLLEYRKLHAYAMEHYVSGTHNVLMIDEVQLCPSFEKVINRVIICSTRSGSYFRSACWICCSPRDTKTVIIFRSFLKSFDPLSKCFYVFLKFSIHLLCTPYF